MVAAAARQHAADGASDRGAARPAACREPDSGIWFRARRPARTYDRQGWDVR